MLVIEHLAQLINSMQSCILCLTLMIFREEVFASNRMSVDDRKHYSHWLVRCSKYHNIVTTPPTRSVVTRAKNIQVNIVLFYGKSENSKK